MERKKEPKIGKRMERERRKEKEEENSGTVAETYGARTIGTH